MKRVVLLVVLALTAFALAGCASTSGTPRQQMNEWAQQAGLPALDSQVNTDLTYVRQAQSKRDLLGLKTDCEGFPGDVENIYETLPSPNSDVTNEFNNATTDWFAAASTCANLSSFASRSYMKYLRQMAAGSAAYNAAQKQLRSFGVQ